MKSTTEFPIQFPRLETERLCLREPRLIDAAALFELMGNPNVTRFYDWDTYENEGQAVGLIETLNQRFIDKNGIRWILELKESKEAIGFAGFFKIEMGFTAGIGYGIKEKFWNQGLMTEALISIASFGINQLDLNRIYAEVIPGNKASEKVLEKIGFQKEGLLRESKYFKGKFNDMILFSLLKRDF